MYKKTRSQVPPSFLSLAMQFFVHTRGEPGNEATKNWGEGGGEESGNEDSPRLDDS